MNLKQKILSCHGKSVSDIDAILNRHKDDDSFVSDVIRLSKQKQLQKITIWLLKKYLENGRKIDVDDVSRLCNLLPELDGWETKLHILQCLPYMKIAKTENKIVVAFLRQCLTNTNKFVRAWAYNGFYTLSTQYPEYKEETKQFFEMAMRDEAPSVRARIRNIVKNGF